MIKSIFFLFIFFILVLNTDAKKKPLKKKEFDEKTIYSLQKTEDISKFLKIHNNERIALGCPPLVWDDNLAKIAANWANHLVKIKKMLHSNNQYGENIFMGIGGDFTLSDAANSWLEEKNNFYGKKYTGKSSHYTQMIWKNTTKVGAAIVKRGQVTICVANYDPPGNFLNENVY